MPHRANADVAMTPEQYATSIERALDVQDQSTRLRAAMAAGTHPHRDLLEPLVRRCGVEPDFFVCEMLSWALTRLPADDVLPRVRRELVSKNVQARTQALHVLSKIGDPRAWPWIRPAFLHDADADLARTAWRAAAALAPESERAALADELSREFGRGDTGTRMALSVAILSLGDAAAAAISVAIREARPTCASMPAPHNCCARAPTWPSVPPSRRPSASSPWVEPAEASSPVTDPARPLAPPASCSRHAANGKDPRRSTSSLIRRGSFPLAEGVGFEPTMGVNP